MQIADDPDVLDVEFRELPAAPRRSTTPAARRKVRSRQARREAAAERRISLQHLAFFNDYLEGLDLAELADQYLEFRRDALKAAATRSWLVTSFVAAARGAPSLEDFPAKHDPDGFYTEKELLDLFAARHAGADRDAGATLRRQQRNARLRARPMAALEALARLVVEDPKPDLHVLGWFDTAVARGPHHDRQAGRDDQRGRVPLVSAHHRLARPLRESRRPAAGWRRAAPPVRAHVAARALFAPARARRIARCAS